MNPNFAAPAFRLGVLALAAALAALAAGCTTTSTDGFLAGDKVDYRTAGVKTAPLEVPPDLTQLARESRYQPQGGVVSAAAATGPQAVQPLATATAAPSVALNSAGSARLERVGQQRWIAVPQTPEQLWPQLKSFWQTNGFTLAEEDAKVGVMETEWSENRAKLPNDIVRNTIGRLFNNLYDTGERDRYRTRVERTPTGSEIYVTHRGAAEVYTSERKDSTTWRARDSDPELEAVFLSRLMVSLGAPAAPTAVAAAPAAPTTGLRALFGGGSAAPAAAAGTTAATAAGGDAATRAREAAANKATSLVVAEPFDRAWRRVGLALDRSGFTVEDRDRTAGLYYVRYVDPKNIGKEEPGWWGRLFGDRSNPQEALRYRVAVKSTGSQSTVLVQKSNGEQEVGDNAQRIVGVLMGELR